MKKQQTSLNKATTNKIDWVSISFIAVAIIILVIVAAVIIMNSINASKKQPQQIIVPTEEETYIQPTTLPDDAEDSIKVRDAVANYIDTFKSCDFEAIKAIIHEDDKWLFNFESEDQLAFYKAIFPKVNYTFEFVAEHEGVYGIMTNITSPSMADIYGTIITEYIDIRTSENPDAVFDTKERAIELINQPDTPLRNERLYIYVEKIDGEYVVRCDAYLANELTGGAPEASDEISSVLNEASEALD